MVRFSERHLRLRRSFALLLTMLLVAQLAVVGSQLSMLVAAESLMVGRVASDLDHELAVDSFLVCLPSLLKQSQDTPGHGSAATPAVRTMELIIGRCHILCEARSEAGKQSVTSRGSNINSLLRELARSNGLPLESIVLRPIAHPRGKKPWPEYFCFDQIIQPHEFEEIFHWRLSSSLLAKASGLTPRPTWSDLISLWHDGTGDTYGLTCVTTIGNDRRRWYVVCSISGDETKVLFRGTAS